MCKYSERYRQNRKALKETIFGTYTLFIVCVCVAHAERNRRTVTRDSKQQIEVLQLFIGPLSGGGGLFVRVLCLFVCRKHEYIEFSTKVAISHI
jgi:hypothetical protein